MPPSEPGLESFQIAKANRSGDIIHMVLPTGFGNVEIPLAGFADG